MEDSNIRSVRLDGQPWFVLADVLASVDKSRALGNPMFVARIPEDQRRQVRMSQRWTWLVTREGADIAAGLEWREHGDPKVIGYDRVATRSYSLHQKEMYDGPKAPRAGVSPRNRAKFAQIADDLRERLRNGEWAPGQKMPRVGDVAKAWGVSGQTASIAFRRLRDEGLLVLVVEGYRVVEMPDA